MPDDLSKHIDSSLNSSSECLDLDCEDPVQTPSDSDLGKSGSLSPSDGPKSYLQLLARMCQALQVQLTNETPRVTDLVHNYTGKRPASNMAIVDVKMLSGFIPVKSSMRKLEMQNQVKRTEVSTNHVLLYLEQVSNVTQSYSFMVEQDVPVQDLKPALVKVYDYYETDEFAVAEYGNPCSTGRV
ncbi:UNVERIFIED_CONTAM: hypothetical protein K2H54_015593 [Gekko kuhli]